jgi:hypothetical protein
VDVGEDEEKCALAGPGKLPNRSVRQKPEISASNPLRFGPKIRYLGQGCHIFHGVTYQDL